MPIRNSVMAEVLVARAAHPSPRPLLASPPLAPPRPSMIAKCLKCLPNDANRRRRRRAAHSI
eukprot:3968337-Prymnesium_polylepis.1